MIRTYIAVSALVACTAAWAADQPYADQHHRDIKALSGDEVKGYLAGAGMGFARAAELNHYPGPMHALELAEQLKLTGEQRAALESLMKRHKSQASELGAAVVSLERRLDSLFASRHATANEVEQTVTKIGEAQARYRTSHLVTHLSTTALLTPEQRARYDVLRGYVNEPAHRMPHKSH